ncbi:MAG: hypothetical protein MHPSP_000132 [Paramarteilia canceri]
MNENSLNTNTNENDSEASQNNQNNLSSVLTFNLRLDNYLPCNSRHYVERIGSTAASTMLQNMREQIRSDNVRQITPISNLNWTIAPDRFFNIMDTIAHHRGNTSFSINYYLSQVEPRLTNILFKPITSLNISNRFFSGFFTGYFVYDRSILSNLFEKYNQLLSSDDSIAQVSSQSKLNDSVEDTRINELLGIVKSTINDEPQNYIKLLAHLRQVFIHIIRHTHLHKPLYVRNIPSENDMLLALVMIAYSDTRTVESIIEDCNQSYLWSENQQSVSESTSSSPFGSMFNIFNGSNVSTPFNSSTGVFNAQGMARGQDNNQNSSLSPEAAQSMEEDQKNLENFKRKNSGCDNFPSSYAYTSFAGDTKRKKIVQSVYDDIDLSKLKEPYATLIEKTFNTIKDAGNDAAEIDILTDEHHLSYKNMLKAAIKERAKIDPNFNESKYPNIAKIANLRSD